MCSDPISASLTAGSILLSAIGQYRDVSAQEEQAEFQAAQMLENAKLAELKAADEIALGNKRKQKKRQDAQRLRSRQLVTMAANGVAIDSVSNRDLLADTDRGTLIELAAIDETTRQRESAFLGQADNFQNQAKMYSKAAGNSNPLLSSIIGGGAQGLTLASKWYKPPKK